MIEIKYLSQDLRRMWLFRSFQMRMSPDNTSIRLDGVDFEDEAGGTVVSVWAAMAFRGSQVDGDLDFVLQVIKNVK